MKKLILIITLILCVSITFATENPKVNTLEVKGFFLKKSNVSYDVCIINSDSSYTPVGSYKGLRTYELNLEVGKVYAVTFIKNNFVKTLYIEVDKAGTMELDVDFTSSYSGKLYYDKYSKKYKVTKISHDHAEEKYPHISNGV